MNHVRVPAVISGLLLLITFPLVLRLSDRDYARASGLHESVYLLRWLLAVAGSPPLGGALPGAPGPLARTRPMTAATTAHPSVLDTTARTFSSSLRRRRLPFGRVAELLVGTVLVVLSLVPVARYLFVVAHRIAYPYELEWMEGGSVEVVHRVVSGHGIYGPPSMHFTPWHYTPLYFWVSAAVAEVTGIGFTPLRLVSFTASLAVLWLALPHGGRRDSDRVAAVVAAGVYAATFRLAGAWADIGRVDSLFLAFTLWALARSRRARSHRDGVIVGVLFFLSFFTKQDGLVVAAPVVAWLLVARRAAGVSALATLVGLVLGSTIVLDAFTHGWYQYYVFGELRSQGWVGENLRFFWQLSILKPFAWEWASSWSPEAPYSYRSDTVSACSGRGQASGWPGSPACSERRGSAACTTAGLTTC